MNVHLYIYINLAQLAPKTTQGFLDASIATWNQCSKSLCFTPQAWKNKNKMRLHVPTYLLLLAVTCSIFGGVEMQVTKSTNSTNSTTSSPSITQSSTTTKPTTLINSAGSTLASGSGSGSVSGGSGGNSSTSSALTSGSLSAGGNALLLFTVSVFFSLALLMK